MIEYKIESDISIDEFREVLINSTLGERRPIDDRSRLAQMLQNANLIVTARDNGKIVGVSRSLTDFVFCTYLSDLAVDKNYQKNGIGKELIRRTKLEAPQAKIILLAAPAATTYYPKIGMERHENCYLLDDINDLQ
ncbi:MAG TPA: GNAT family N-acetyltransferase [Membranihabitans sp.]|nr:GNAT family N-acetyltransferase [Membranihabitans sp.]